MFQKIRDLLEMIRFSHTLFALPFALLGGVMAWATPLPAGRPVPFRPRDLLGIILCMFFARSAAMAFNRIADRRLDALNPRTQGRHLPTGRLTVLGVVLFTAVCSAGFVASTLLFLPNRLPLYCAAPVLLWLFGYSYAKRFTTLAHFWLGSALMLSPPAAWVALRGETVLQHPLDILPAALLAGAVLFWVAGFDIIYACQDFAFDRRTGLYSIPARLGIAPALRLAAVCHAAMVAVLAAVPICCPRVGFGAIYWTGLAAGAVLLIYEHRLVKPDDLTRVNTAFFHLNAIIGIGLFLIGSIDLLW